MLSLRKPSTDAVRAFAAAQAGLDFTYNGVGATAAVPPAGYVVDHTRARVGTGPAAFEAAKAALDRWDQFRLGWVDVWPPAGPIAVGGVAAVGGRSLGVWWLNACRVVYVVDERAADAPVARYGFAYGTLPGHIESGEERFLVEWDRGGDGGVWFDILAFSRPRHVLAKLGKPWVRRLQKRFGRSSAAAMVRVVGAAIGAG